jgi:hypothetical protein
MSAQAFLPTRYPPHLPSTRPDLPDLPLAPQPYLFFTALGGGPGLYSSITLLTTAIGRPGCE